jgi:hypothetical protein
VEVAEDAASDGCLWVEPAFDVDRYNTLRANNGARARDRHERQSH